MPDDTLRLSLSCHTIFFQNSNRFRRHNETETISVQSKDTLSMRLHSALPSQRFQGLLQPLGSQFNVSIFQCGQRKFSKFHGIGHLRSGRSFR